MTNFPKPIERFEDGKNKDWSSPPVQRIEKDRKPKDEGSNSSKNPPSANSFLFAALALYCKNFLSAFPSKDGAAELYVNLKLVEEHLESFKKFLRDLSHEDVSRAPVRTRGLSNLWVLLLDDLNRVESFEKE